MPLAELRLEMSRAAAEEHLAPLPPGSFVIRNSSKSGFFTLSIRIATQKTYFHQLVEASQIGIKMQYSLNKSQKTFDSFEDLVKHYSENKSMQLPCKLVPASLGRSESFSGGNRRQSASSPTGSSAAAAPQHEFDNEPWFVGMLRPGRTQEILGNAQIGDFVIRESASSTDSYVLACKETTGVVEYKISLSGGMFGYDAQRDDPRAPVYPTLQLLCDAAPTASIPRKDLFEHEVRMASNASKIKSREIDEMIANMRVTEVPKDFGLDGEEWYVHNSSVDNAKSILRGAGPGFYVIVPDENEGRDFYTLVMCERSGVATQRISRMGGIYKNDDTMWIGPTLADAVAASAGCTKPARFMFTGTDLSSKDAKMQTLGGHRRAAQHDPASSARNRSGTMPAVIKQPTNSYLTMKKESFDGFEELNGSGRGYVNGEVIDSVIAKRQEPKHEEITQTSYTIDLPDEEEDAEYEDVEKDAAGRTTLKSTSAGSYTAKPRISDGASAWSVGCMPREECKKKMTRLSNGCFVVRKSATHPTAQVLVVQVNGKAVERKIAFEDEQYLIQDRGDVQAFPNMIDLLESIDIATVPSAAELLSGGDKSITASDFSYDGRGELPPEQTGASYVNVTAEDIARARASTMPNRGVQLGRSDARMKNAGESYVNVTADDIALARRKKLSDQQDRKTYDEKVRWDTPGGDFDDDDDEEYEDY